MQITLEQVLLGVGAAMIIGLLSVLWFFVRSERSDLKREMEQNRADLKQELETNERRARDRHAELGHQQDRLRTELHQLRESLPDRYVSKIDWAEFRGWLTALLARIETKIDGKADRGSRGED